MKFCLFYAWRDMCRRPLRFISLGCFLGISGFVMTTFCLLLTVYSGKPTEALRQFGVLYIVFGALLTVVMGYLCLERYRNSTAEYNEMRQLGLTDAQLQKIHLLQMLILSVAALPAAHTVSAFIVRRIVFRNAAEFDRLRQELTAAFPEWYISHLSVPSLSCEFPLLGGILVCCFAAMLVMGMTASLWAHVRYRRRNRGISLSSLGERAVHTITDMHTYRRETNTRMRASVRLLHAASTAALLLPIFFLGAALLFTDASAIADMVITTRETVHTTIDPALIAQISSICGAEQVRALIDGDIVWALQIDLPDASWIASAAEILHLDGISSYDVSVSQLSVTVSDLKSEQLRQSFFLMATASFLAAGVSIIFIIHDLFAARNTEFRVLHMYGIRGLFHIRANAVYHLLFPCCMTAGVIGTGLVIGMDQSSGAIWDAGILTPVLCGIGLGVILPAVFACVAAGLYHTDGPSEDL